MSTVKIVIVVEGGLVQSIYADRKDVEVVILDGDTEGVSKDELTEVEHCDGCKIEWIVSSDEVLLDHKFVQKVHDQYNTQGGDRDTTGTD